MNFHWFEFLDATDAKRLAVTSAFYRTTETSATFRPMEDRRIRRAWVLDLTTAGRRPESPSRAGGGRRQQIAFFERREGSEEHFSVWLTFPNDEDDPETPPTRKQYDTVSAFYGEGPASRLQAEYLVSTWFYADEIRSSRNFGFSAPRRRLIHLATAAYLLSQPQFRRSIRAWSALQWRQPTRAVPIQRTSPYKPALEFASDLIVDMQAAGAEIFG